MVRKPVQKSKISSVRKEGVSTFPSRISCLRNSVHRPSRHRTREGSHSAVVNRRVDLYPSSHSEGKVSLANSREGFEGTLESNSMCTKEVRSVFSCSKSDRNPRSEESREKKDIQAGMRLCHRVSAISNSKPSAEGKM
jgi:hypothetical protein